MPFARTGTGENETEDDELCREIYELWAARAEEADKEPKKQKARSKAMSEGIRQKALQGLKPRGKGKTILKMV